MKVICKTMQERSNRPWHPFTWLDRNCSTLLRLTYLSTSAVYAYRYWYGIRRVLACEWFGDCGSAATRWGLPPNTDDGSHYWLSAAYTMAEPAGTYMTSRRNKIKCFLKSKWTRWLVQSDRSPSVHYNESNNVYYRKRRRPTAGPLTRLTTALIALSFYHLWLQL